MVTALPARVMNYKVSAASPTGELLTIGQILSEVGDCASTILDREHLSFTRKCANRLKKVVVELTSRGCIQSPDDLYKIQQDNAGQTDLAKMTIDQLHRLYRQWPIRHQQRLKEGREHMTYYYEGRIVKELQNRKPATKDEQLKIDYCAATYHNELENLSFIFSCPVDTGNAKIHPEKTKAYSPDELAELIKRYTPYRDITERELLIQYVDIALDMLDRNGCNHESCRLLNEIADLGTKNLIRVPEWTIAESNQPN